MSIYHNPFLVKIAYAKGNDFGHITITEEYRPSDRWPVKHHFMFNIKALYDHEFYYDHSYFEEDGNNILKVHWDAQDDSEVSAKLTFVSESVPAKIFYIPDFKMEELFNQYILTENVTGNVNLSFLAHSTPTFPHLDFSNAQKSVREMASDKLKRRAFMKGIRNSFKWVDAKEIKFFNDWDKGSFAFTEYFDNGKSGMSGGFICHECTGYDRPGSYKYEVHT